MLAAVCGSILARLPMFSINWRQRRCPMTSDTPLLVDAAATAKMIGVSRATLDRMLSSNLFGPAAVRVCRRYMYRADEIRDWCNAGCPVRNKWAWGGGAMG